MVASTARNHAPLQYIAPYAGTSMAELFMHKGKDVLIVYDDLEASRWQPEHCPCYLDVPLDVRHIPVMYSLHSRLLERSVS